MALTATLHMGYMGSAKINGVSYFMSGSSLNPTQTVEAPDIVGGHYMKRGWMYGKVDIAGNVTAPLHDMETPPNPSLWTLAFERELPAGDHLTYTDIPIEIAFYKGGGWKFNACAINSLQIAVTAGEVVNFTADFAGKKKEGGAAVEALTGGSTAIPCSKLVTWDRVSFTAPTGSLAMQSMTFTLNNNIQKAYAVMDTIDEVSGLYPVDIPCGVREITGTISAYAEGDISDLAGGVNPGANPGAGADAWNLYSADNTQDITLTVQGTSAAIINVAFKAVFSRPEGAGQTGLAIYTLNFTGLCDAT